MTGVQTCALPISRQGPSQANKEWDRKLRYLAPSPPYRFGRWSGDLFNKSNPLWQEVGVVKLGRSGGKLTVFNTGGARSECGRVLRQLLSLGTRPEDLKFLAAR